MTGFDASPAMLELARQRLGATADLYLADLSKPLPFADGSFDDVARPWSCTIWRTGQHHLRLRRVLNRAAA